MASGVIAISAGMGRLYNQTGNYSDLIEQADDIFYYIYEEAGINRPHGGIICIPSLAMSTPFILPELPDEK